MWFRVLSLVIGAALLGKAAIALAGPRRFYDERQRQFALGTPPPKLLVATVVIVFITFAAWYATIFHYQPWGWMLRVVTNPKVWWVDCVLLVVDAVFVALGWLVY